MIVKRKKTDIEEAIGFFEKICTDKRTLPDIKQKLTVAVICMDICEKQLADDDEIKVDMSDKLK